MASDNSQVPQFGFMNQDTSYSAVSRHDDPDIRDQRHRDDVELDQISQLSQPYKSTYNVQHDDAVSALTDEETRNLGYNPASKPGLPAQVSKTKPGWEVLLADVVAIGAPLGLLVFAIILWSKDQKNAEEDQIRAFQNATQVVSPL